MQKIAISPMLILSLSTTDVDKRCKPVNSVKQQTESLRLSDKTMTLTIGNYSIYRM